MPLIFVAIENDSFKWVNKLHEAFRP